MDFLVAYDIFDNKRRRKIQKYLYELSKSYQKSVIEIEEIKTVGGVQNIVSKLLEFSEEEDIIAIFSYKSVLCIGKSQEVEFLI